MKKEEKKNNTVADFTVEDFIKRLKELPKDLHINGYIFQTYEEEVINTFGMREWELAE